MASESTSSQQSQQLPPSSNVNFKCEDGIIAFNNAVALLEHPNELYRPMLSFLLNCCISKALTLQPSAIYVEYLKEFWYTTEVDEATKTITFSLSWCDKSLTFTQDEFISAIGLPICKDVVPLPPKETVRAGLATLGLINKDKPTLSSTVLVNSSPLKIKYFTPIWKLFMQYIIKCLDLIHKLQNRKKNMESNICYTRFLSSIYEKLLGEKYISNDLTLVKPHTISTASFQKPLASEVPLTLHMLKVAKLSEEPDESLIPPSGEVNADDTADKSLSRASVQPVTQLKAPTDLKIKKKRITPSSKPESLYKVRVILLKKPVTETQHAEVIVAAADATKSLVASKLAEDQGNQSSAADSEKVQDQKIQEVKESELDPLEDVTFDQIMDKIDQRNKDVEKAKSPYDTESEIKIIKSFQDASDSGLRSMHDDDLASLTSFDSQDSSDHISDGESNITKQVFVSIKSSVPLIMVDTLKEQLLGLLSDDLKDTLPQLIKDSIKNSVSESITEELP
ncbi:hypothetical protein Tco_0817280 [Tanacetum coccineum]